MKTLLQPAFLATFFLFISCRATVLAQSEAFLNRIDGSSFGVGCIVIPVSPNELPPGGVESVQIYEANHRILYPAFEIREVPREVTNTFLNAKRSIGRFVGEILSQTGTSVAVYFLFVGNQTPLDITIITNRATRHTITPTQHPIKYNRLLQDWWGRYNKETVSLIQTNDYPPVVKEYLRTMLSFRLGLKRPETKPSFWDKLLSTDLGFQLDPTVVLFETQTNLFFNAERYTQNANLDLPQSLEELIHQQPKIKSVPTSQQPRFRPIAYVPQEQGEQQANKREKSKEEQEQEKNQQDESAKKLTALWDSLTQSFSIGTSKNDNQTDAVSPGNDSQSQYEQEGIEQIAFHVPAHCFYIRYGSYSNFAWFQDTTAIWGGDLRNLIASRAFQTRSGMRLEQQIGLRQDTLAKLFGNSVIDDVAVIGTDLFFDDGASFGLLFRAKNNDILTNDFNTKRQALLKSTHGATETLLDIDGERVSYISTPDQRIRTFYAAMGDYHLVTRSEQLARDFVALHKHQGSNATKSLFNKHLSLGELPEFHQVRGIMPLEQKSTIFIYFSRPYFYNLCSPAYWIETQRRNTSAARIELLRLGGMAAAAEGHGQTNVSEWMAMLKSNGYIPPNFGQFPDGSDTILESWTNIRDSLRGYRGSFLPIADMLPNKVTESEYQQYQKMCQNFFENWDKFDPVVVSIRRAPYKSPEGKQEHIIIDARIAPLSAKNRSTLYAHLGQPTTNKLAPLSGNFASFELSLAENYLFGALQNEVPPRLPSEQPRPVERIMSGILLKNPHIMLSDLFAGYFGYFGQPGKFLKLWGWTFQWIDDAAGYARSIDGTWRRHYGNYTLYSRQRAILDLIAPQLGFVPAEYAAQLRVNIGNPLTSRIAAPLNNFGYARTCDTIRGNLRLLNDLQMQFHVSGQHCQEVAETILDADLICPLGGKYVYQPFTNTLSDWGRWQSTVLNNLPNTPNSAVMIQAPSGFLAPPLNWFRGGKLDALVSPDAVSVHAELEMLLPK
ncbi:MAG: hypothetical protein LBJ67_16320 [Planctomycetaceae bacterium]|jgi:hypothetical protein|nr:hypothetical protein [Planctomycetaceae bacterium]